MLELSKCLGEKTEFEVPLLSSFVIPVRCDCQKSCFPAPQQQCFSWAEHGFWASSCIQNQQITSRGSLLPSAHIWKVLAFLELYSLWFLLFGWFLMPYTYTYFFFCNWSSFLNRSQWGHWSYANYSISLGATFLCRFQLSTTQVLIGIGI